MVSPLPSTSREHTSRGNSLSLNVLERSQKDSPITSQKCHSCQVNKLRNYKYDKLPAKLTITTPWEALCVDLIGPYTLKGIDKTEIDVVCITMIDPATSWFKIAELPISQPSEFDIPMNTKGSRAKTNISNKNNRTLTNRQQQSEH